MIVNGSDIIAKQLSIETETKVKFDKNHHTVINPVRFTPEPEDCRLSLDGEWLVKNYPFKDKVFTESTRNWSTVQQPGKVFYADPEAECQPIENWNRVSMDFPYEKIGMVAAQHLLKEKFTAEQQFFSANVIKRESTLHESDKLSLNNNKDLVLKS